MQSVLEGTEQEQKQETSKETLGKIRNDYDLEQGGCEEKEMMMSSEYIWMMEPEDLIGCGE